MASTFNIFLITGFSAPPLTFVLLPQPVSPRNFRLQQLVLNVMRKALIISLITATSILLLTCGETEIQPPPPPIPGPGNGPPASGPITDEQRLAVLKECKDFVNALGDLKSEAVQQVIVGWLKARPEFEDAGIAEGNVSGYLQGRQGRHDRSELARCWR